jgi:hypothetical protein
VRLATPYLFASLGEMVGQRSGVLNLGVEGMMLMGAFAAYYTTLQTGNPWLGVVAALVVGASMGLLMAVISVTMQAEQGISGIGLSLFGLGLSSLLLKVLVGAPKSISGVSAARDSNFERHSHHRRDLLRPQYPGRTSPICVCRSASFCSTAPPSASRFAPWGRTRKPRIRWACASTQCATPP